MSKERFALISQTVTILALLAALFVFVFGRGSGKEQVKQPEKAKTFGQMIIETDKKVGEAYWMTRKNIDFIKKYAKGDTSYLDGMEASLHLMLLSETAEEFAAAIDGLSNQLRKAQPMIVAECIDIERRTGKKLEDVK